MTRSNSLKSSCTCIGLYEPRCSPVAFFTNTNQNTLYKLNCVDEVDEQFTRGKVVSANFEEAVGCVNLVHKKRRQIRLWNVGNGKFPSTLEL